MIQIITLQLQEKLSTLVLLYTISVFITKEDYCNVSIELEDEVINIIGETYNVELHQTGIQIYIFDLEYLLILYLVSFMIKSRTKKYFTSKGFNVLLSPLPNFMQFLFSKISVTGK